MVNGKAFFGPQSAVVTRKSGDLMFQRCLSVLGHPLSLGYDRRYFLARSCPTVCSAKL